MDIARITTLLVAVAAGFYILNEVQKRRRPAAGDYGVEYDTEMLDEQPMYTALTGDAQYEN